MKKEHRAFSREAANNLGYSTVSVHNSVEKWKIYCLTG
jgi:hypothetical protein